MAKVLKVVVPADACWDKIVIVKCGEAKEVSAKIECCEAKPAEAAAAGGEKKEGECAGQPAAGATT